MAMGAGKIICAVTPDTGRIRGDGYDPWPVGWVLQLRWCRVTVTALVGVDCHWRTCLMTTNTEWGVKDMAEAGSRVIRMEVGSRRRLILMAV